MLYALSPVSKINDLGWPCQSLLCLRCGTISTKVYWIIILCDDVCLRRSLVM